MRIIAGLLSLLIPLVFFLGVDFYVWEGIQSAFRKFGNIHYIKSLFWAFNLFVYGILAWIIFAGWHRPVWRKKLGPIIFLTLLPKLVFCLFLLGEDVTMWIMHYVKPGTSGFRNLLYSQITLVLSAFPVVLLIYGITFNAYRYRIIRQEINASNLPADLAGLKIIHISDIHSGTFRHPEKIKKGIDMINAENPDLVFFTGDLVNNLADEMDPLVLIFGSIKSKLGIYSIFGNHDYGDYVRWPNAQAKINNLNKLKGIHHKMGWKLLLNENLMLQIGNTTLGIAGVENWSAGGRFSQYGILSKALDGMEKADFKILLSHDPSHWEAEILKAEPKIDLTLSGHTHGFQFGFETKWFRWSPSQYVYKQWAGRYEKAGQFLYVNRGFGNLGYPGRVGILPEITVLQLEN